MDNTEVIAWKEVPPCCLLAPVAFEYLLGRLHPLVACTPSLTSLQVRLTVSPTSPSEGNPLPSSPVSQGWTVAVASVLVLLVSPLNEQIAFPVDAIAFPVPSCRHFGSSCRLRAPAKTVFA